MATSLPNLLKQIRDFKSLSPLLIPEKKAVVPPTLIGAEPYLAWIAHAKVAKDAKPRLISGQVRGIGKRRKKKSEGLRNFSGFGQFNPR